MVNKELIYVNIYNEIELVDDLLIMKDPIVNNHILKGFQLCIIKDNIYSFYTCCCTRNG